jgi:hypothetical protein
MPNNRCHGIAMRCLWALSASLPRFFTAANTGTVLSNESGNRNGIITVKVREQVLDLFYDTAAFEIRPGALVAIVYRPERADYDGVLISIEHKDYP